MKVRLEMSKLGYTWYPKDWGNSESVFELNLTERGLYREFIDLAMLNDNTTEIKKDVWIRKFCVSKEDLEFILCKLITLNLVEIIDNILFIPSCESRLKLVRGGSNGGKKSKPTPKPYSKPTPKPFGSLDEKNTKPTPKQIEKKEKGKEIESKIKLIDIYFEDFKNSSYLEDICNRQKVTKEQVLNKLEDFKLKMNLEYPDYISFCTHFKNWFSKLGIVGEKKEYLLTSPQGKHKFLFTEDELKAKKLTGYWKEQHEL